MDLQPMGKYEWLDLILRMRIPPQRKAVAQALAWFGRPDGSRVRPGQKKVADMAGVHVSKAGPHIRALREDGLLKLVKAGGGRGGDPDHFQLSRPADISTLPLWLDPDMDRYPAGGPTEEIHRPSAVGVAGSATTEQEPPEVDETGEQEPPTVSVPPVDNSEHRPPAVGETGGTPTADGLNSPVDNSKHRPFRSETQTVLNGNNDRGRSTNTLRTPSEHLLGSPQATNSLAAGNRTEPPTPIDAAANGHDRTLAAAFLDGEETAVREETPAGRTQTLAEHAAARRVLDHLPDREHWLNEARDELGRRDRPAPPTAFVTCVAAELYRRNSIASGA